MLLVDFYRVASSSVLTREVQPATMFEISNDCLFSIIASNRIKGLVWLLVTSLSVGQDMVPHSRAFLPSIPFCVVTRGYDIRPVPQLPNLKDMK
ncbi:14120_t:CDS:2, partial [Acaulospora colombiana]